MICCISFTSIPAWMMEERKSSQNINSTSSFDMSNCVQTRLLLLLLLVSSLSVLTRFASVIRLSARQPSLESAGGEASVCLPIHPPAPSIQSRRQPGRSFHVLGDNRVLLTGRGTSARSSRPQPSDGRLSVSLIPPHSPTPPSTPCHRCSAADNATCSLGMH